MPVISDGPSKSGDVQVAADSRVDTTAQLEVENPLENSSLSSSTLTLEERDRIIQQEVLQRKEESPLERLLNDNLSNQGDHPLFNLDDRGGGLIGGSSTLAAGMRIGGRGSPMPPPYNPYNNQADPVHRLKPMPDDYHLEQLKRNRNGHQMDNAAKELDESKRIAGAGQKSGISSGLKSQQQSPNYKPDSKPTSTVKKSRAYEDVLLRDKWGRVTKVNTGRVVHISELMEEERISNSLTRRIERRIARGIEEGVEAVIKAGRGVGRVLAPAARTAGRVLGPTLRVGARVVGPLMAVYDVASSIVTDPNKVRGAVAGVGAASGAVAGAWAGGVFGAEIGAAVGSIVPGAGTAAGAAVGGFVGSVVGAVAGSSVGKAVGRAVYSAGKTVAEKVGSAAESAYQGAKHAVSSAVKWVKGWFS